MKTECAVARTPRSERLHPRNFYTIRKNGRAIALERECFGMPITPAEFEDKMKVCKDIEAEVALMVNTLDSLGYEAGIRVFLSHRETP